MGFFAFALPLLAGAAFVWGLSERIQDDARLKLGVECAGGTGSSLFLTGLVFLLESFGVKLAWCFGVGILLTLLLLFVPALRKP
ncbi:MAG: hypothetical protein QOH01_454 [Verrucomicrobiota bacterium]|jgi:hypothetical protein